MCYHTSQKTTGHEIAKAINAPFPQADQFQPIYHANGFAHPEMAVLSAEGGRSLHLYRWGLIPFWVQTNDIAKKLSNQTLNAKSETIFTLPSFRGSIVKNRCIIPVDGFFEWKHVGKEKIPYFIHPKEHPYFYLAGIHSKWKNPLTDLTETTFSIITTEANELMADIHNTKKRMPLMISENNMDAWIDPGLNHQGIVDLMQPCDDRSMAAYTVSSDIAKPSVNTNTPEVTNPVNYEIS